LIASAIADLLKSVRPDIIAQFALSVGSHIVADKQTDQRSRAAERVKKQCSAMAGATLDILLLQRHTNE
jgi:hypothetical protein